MTTIENLLQKRILSELENGRPNWDMPHTLAVVENLKSILEHSKHLNLDETVLLIAAYAHDWGYAGLFGKGKELSNLNDVLNVKEAHMEIGAKKLEELLNEVEFDGLTSEQKVRAVHLVKIHDKLPEISDVDERVLLEADTLGGLDVEKVTPSFDKKSNDRYMKTVKEKRLPLFITEYGKEQFKQLYKTRIDFYESKKI